MLEGIQFVSPMQRTGIMKIQKRSCVILISILLGACQYFTQKNRSEDSTTVSRNIPNSSSFPVNPDTSIHASNAYNDLFLDTASIPAYITKNKLAEVDAKSLKGFYNLRNNQFCWFSKDGLTEQGRLFWNAYTYSKSHGEKDGFKDKVLSAKMDKILNADTLQIAADDTAFQEIEIALTQRFIPYYDLADADSYIHELPITLLLPARKMNPITMADSILNYQAGGAQVNGVNNSFYALKQKLSFYDSLAKNGGWQTIEINDVNLKEDLTPAVVKGIKRRLAVTGELAASDTSSESTDSLETAVRMYQQQNGFEANGVVDDSLINAMNIPVDQRVRQILVNMNRMAWLPPSIKNNFVQVNIPDFVLDVYDGDSIPVKMEVIVGSEGSSTMVFTGDLNQVVFSPVWHIPASIVKNEILPKMNADPNYLKSKNMVIIRHNDSLPEINQLPGTGNVLGRVKFLFPNSYDIYLHDTEAKELFENKNRALSHGCIRLADAKRMSEYILRNNAGWNSDKIERAMNAGKEQFVAVKNPIPVMITYFTCWVDRTGEINFRDDIYGHDKRTSEMMFYQS